MGVSMVVGRAPRSRHRKGLRSRLIASPDDVTNRAIRSGDRDRARICVYTLLSWVPRDLRIPALFESREHAQTPTGQTKMEIDEKIERNKKTIGAKRKIYILGLPCSKSSASTSVAFLFAKINSAPEIRIIPFIIIYFLAVNFFRIYPSIHFYFFFTHSLQIFYFFINLWFFFNELLCSL